MNQFGFDLTKKEFVEETNLITPGSYNAEIISVSIIPSKKNTEGIKGYEEAYNLCIEYSILDEGRWKNYVVKEWLSIHNPNRTAQQIARQKLNKLLVAVSIIPGVDTEPQELFNKIVGIEVINKDDNISIKKYYQSAFKKFKSNMNLDHIPF